MILSLVAMASFGALSDTPFDGIPGVVEPSSLGEGRMRAQLGWEWLSARGAVSDQSDSSGIASASRIENFRFGFAWGAGTWTDLAISGVYHSDRGLPIRESDQSGFGDSWLRLRQELPIDGVDGPVDLGFVLGVGIPTGERGVGVFPRDRFQQIRAGREDSLGSTAFGGNGFALEGTVGLGLDLRHWNVPVRVFGSAGMSGASVQWTVPELRLGLGTVVALGRRLEGFAGSTWDAPLRSGDSIGDPRAKVEAGVALRIGDSWRVQGDIWSAISRGAPQAFIWKPSPQAASRGFLVAQSAPAGWSIRLAADFGQPRPDADGDGIPDALDRCPEEAEDFDGWRDGDGCPDPDNDSDGVCDPWVERAGKLATFAGICHGIDLCPELPEDPDGWRDGDGCPDPDDDSDGICDPWVAKKSEAIRYAGVCTGSDACPRVPEDKDGWKDDDGCPDPDDDGDGIPDAMDRCPREGVSDTFDLGRDGCLLRPGRVEAPRLTDSVRPPAAKTGSWVVRFESGIDTLDPAQERILDSVKRFVDGCVACRISLVGHADASGESERNQDLSERRTRFVRDRLRGRGVPESVISAVGHGVSDPAALNFEESGRALNRRVEIRASGAVP